MCRVPRMLVRRAHPRSRGEHVLSFDAIWLAMGSSPLTRGAPWADSMIPPSTGLIPAHAGSTGRHAHHHHRARAHPRSRGEHCTTSWVRSRLVGSSPLTRGARCAGCPEKMQNGLIPAHAGSTTSSHHIARVGSAHPRSRGEHRPRILGLRRRSGSSPLTRGAPGTNPYTEGVGGLIPAHAGSTTCPCLLRALAWAHPRSRGEHCVGQAGSQGPLGSSPLTRGARRRKTDIGRSIGLIPAHAGSTLHQTPPNRTLQAHPRSRGEHPFRRSSSSRRGGSSPLTRGARQPIRETTMPSRLIPAHAGSTTPRS